MRVRFLLRQLWYDLVSGMFFRPTVIVASLAVAGILTGEVTGRHPELRFLFNGEPAAAQLILATIAGSTMTVISVVYSILLVALSLASMQFSTRVLGELTRDSVSQTTLGLFLGTFVYSLLVMRLVSSGPPAVVPEIGVVAAMGLSLASMAQLVYFIHHISQLIQANYLVARIADASVSLVGERAGAVSTRGPVSHPQGLVAERRVVSTDAGYVQVLDAERLRAVASEGHGLIEVVARVGRFVAEGSELAVVRSPAELDPGIDDEVRAAFDLGPIRTMQDDVEWGIRQIVDIALKAVSPAVNDPSTACTCVDHLMRIVGAASRCPAPSRQLVDDRGTVRVLVEAASPAELLDLAVTQLRQYTRGDMAVPLRIVRLLDTVHAASGDERLRERARFHAKMIVEASQRDFCAEDRDELTRRAERLVR